MLAAAVEQKLLISFEALVIGHDHLLQWLLLALDWLLCTFDEASTLRVVVFQARWVNCGA